jgi:hypothetical protein
LARQRTRYLVLGLLLAWWLIPGRSLAQGDKTVIYSDADYTFGQTMRFRLIAEQVEDVESVILHFQTPEFPNTLTVDVPFSAGDRIDVVHSVELSQVRLAPFTVVTYWWTLVTRSGEEIAVPEQIIAYDDNRFNWRQLSRPGLSVYWTGDDPGLGQLAMDVVIETIPALQSLVPASAGTEIRLYVYPSSADLRSALRLTGLDWVGAHADPELGVLMVTAVNARTAATDLRQSIPHELVHFLLYHAVGSNYDDLPKWFNEGLATFMEPVTNPGYEVLLQEAVADEATIPFAELCTSFPEVEERALLAYAQSASLIAYIQDRYGNRKLVELVDAFADGAGCQSGVSRVLRTNLVDLERTWLGSQQAQSPLAQYLSQHGLWLMLLSGGFIVARILIFNPGKKR